MRRRGSVAQKHLKNPDQHCTHDIFYSVRAHKCMLAQTYILNTRIHQHETCTYMCIKKYIYIYIYRYKRIENARKRTRRKGSLFESLEDLVVSQNHQKCLIVAEIEFNGIKGTSLVQGGEDSQDPLSLQVIFRKSDVCLLALLSKMICNLGDPMSLRHPEVRILPGHWYLPVDSIFRKSDVYVVALLSKMICNLGDPMSLHHPIARILP